MSKQWTPEDSILNKPLRLALVVFGIPIVFCAVLATCAHGQTISNDKPPPVITIPGTMLSPMHLEPWTNGRYIIRDMTGKQVGTVEPYPNGWIVRDRQGRESGRVGR